MNKNIVETMSNSEWEKRQAMALMLSRKQFRPKKIRYQNICMECKHWLPTGRVWGLCGIAANRYGVRWGTHTKKNWFACGWDFKPRH